VAAALGIHLALYPGVESTEQRHIGGLGQTLKRDYASNAIFSDASTILALLPEWMDDYCEVHPQSGLRFCSPREFLRLSA